jgi:hypothetical protein
VDAGPTDKQPEVRGVEEVESHDYLHQLQADIYIGGKSNASTIPCLFYLEQYIPRS